MIKVPGFTLSHRLGQGTYGQVYMAKKFGSNNKMVAIKCILKTKLNKRGQDNLVSEISILKTLKHPHIVCMLDFNWDGTYVYLIMEYCAGGDLSKFIRQKKRLSETLVHHFLQQLALALQYLREKNIVHMDLKPQNILLTSVTHPTLKVADFGFAQSLESTVQMNEVRGTLLYMAPEIYCEGIYHPSCDLWSVGIIMYECIFGAPPYVSTNIQGLIEKLMLDEPIQLPSAVKITEPCESLLLGLLKRKPKERLNHSQFFSHPFVDLEHAPSHTSLDRAVDYLERAKQLESDNSLSDAYDCYLEGLTLLVAASKYERAENVRNEIRRMIESNLLHAESLKSKLQASSKAPPRPKPADLTRTCKSKANNDSAIKSDFIQPVKKKPISKVIPSHSKPVRPKPPSTYAKSNPKKSSPTSSSPSVPDDTSEQNVNAQPNQPISKQSSNPMVNHNYNHINTIESNSLKYSDELVENNTNSDNLSKQSSDSQSSNYNNGILTRIKQWFFSSPSKPPSNQSTKDIFCSSTHKFAGETAPADVPTGLLVDITPGSPLSLETTESKSDNSGSLAQQAHPTSSLSTQVNVKETDPQVQKDNLAVNSHPDAIFQNSQTGSKDKFVIPDSMLENFARVRLCQLVSLGTDLNVLGFFNQFYKLIYSRLLDDALFYFESNFENCLLSVKSDAKEKRRIALLDELKLAMDQAEKIKSYLVNRREQTEDNTFSDYEIAKEVDENSEFFDNDDCKSM